MYECMLLPDIRISSISTRSLVLSHGQSEHSRVQLVAPAPIDLISVELRHVLRVPHM